jgi:hypothetical protein
LRGKKLRALRLSDTLTDRIKRIFPVAVTW